MRIKTGYIYMTDMDGRDTVALPYPSVGSAPFAAEEQYVRARNAYGVEVGQRIGPPIVTMELGWARMDYDQWLTVSRFFWSHGDAFVCEYYNLMIGEWRTAKFIKDGPLSGQPVRVDSATGKPRYMTDVTFTARSIGETED